MTVIEVMEATNLIHLARKITLDISEFCEITGHDKSFVYSRIKYRFFPENIIVGGYDGRKQKTKLLFHTDMVIEWLKNKK